jgi:hypothetical protein
MRFSSYTANHVWVLLVLGCVVLRLSRQQSELLNPRLRHELSLLCQNCYKI